MSREEAIVELLKAGPSTVSAIARRLGMSYGAAQWHIHKLERMGVVRTVRAGRRRYVYLAGSSGWERAVSVEDVLEALSEKLREVRGLSVAEAASRLRDPGLAEILREAAERLFGGGI